MVENRLTERKKIVHHLDTPYSAVAWPDVSQEDQDAILELLCNLLSPIGNHRRAHITPSKGKRRKVTEKQDTNSGNKDSPPIPSKPVISDHVSIGLTSVIKSMTSGDSGNGRRPCMIFVARGDQPSAFNCHFPTMVASASHFDSSDQSIRLVGFSKACSDRLSECLGIARVSSLAVFPDAPGSGGLWNMVRDVVPQTKAPWLEKGTYLPTKINATQTSVGVKRAREG